MEDIIQRAGDIIVEKESQQIIAAIDEDVESDQDEDISGEERNSDDEFIANEKEIEKEDAVTTGFKEAPYSATFVKESVNDVDDSTNARDFNVEDIIAVNSSTVVLETSPPAIVIDEYQTDVERESRPTSGMGKKKKNLIEHTVLSGVNDLSNCVSAICFPKRHLYFHVGE